MTHRMYSESVAAVGSIDTFHTTAFSDTGRRIHANSDSQPVARRELLRQPEPEITSLPMAQSTNAPLAGGCDGSLRGRGSQGGSLPLRLSDTIVAPAADPVLILLPDGSVRLIDCQCQQDGSPLTAAMVLQSLPLGHSLSSLDALLQAPRTSAVSDTLSLPFSSAGCHLDLCHPLASHDHGSAPSDSTGSLGNSHNRSSKGGGSASVTVMHGAHSAPACPSPYLEPDCVLEPGGAYLVQADLSTRTSGRDHHNQQHATCPSSSQDDDYSSLSMMVEGRKESSGTLPSGSPLNLPATTTSRGTLASTGWDVALAGGGRHKEAEATGRRESRRSPTWRDGSRPTAHQHTVEHHHHDHHHHGNDQRSVISPMALALPRRSRSSAEASASWHAMSSTAVLQWKQQAVARAMKKSTSLPADQHPPGTTRCHGGSGSGRPHRACLPPPSQHPDIASPHGSPLRATAQATAPHPSLGQAQVDGGSLRGAHAPVRGENMRSTASGSSGHHDGSSAAPGHPSTSAWPEHSRFGSGFLKAFQSPDAQPWRDVDLGMDGWERKGKQQSALCEACRGNDKILCSVCLRSMWALQQQRSSAGK